jgi:hypothetical protein
MRTTFTVDDDLILRLRQKRREAGTSMAKVVNALIRAGLDASPRKRRRLKTRTFRSKVLVENLDNVADVLEVLEGPSHR